MALIALVLVAAWTLIVVRLFAVRATLSGRTVATYLALGALMALTAAPLAEKLLVPYPLNPYGYGYFFSDFFRGLIRNLVLLAPVFSYLFARRMHRVTTVADAFLLAFAVGFGFELVGAVPAAGVAAEPLKGLSLFPPWYYGWDWTRPVVGFGAAGQFGIAGAGYSTGLAALLLAAMLRFWRNPRSTVLVSAAALLIVTADEAIWMKSIYTPPKGLAALFDTLLFHGKLTALATLIALVYFSHREIRWIAEATGAARPDKLQLLDDFKHLLSAALGGPRAYLRARLLKRREIQLQLVKAELAHARNDPQLLQSARLLENQQAEFAAGPIGAADFSPPPPLGRLVAWAAWVGLALIVVALPRLPASLAANLWKFPLLNFQLPMIHFTLLHAALVLLLLWWLVRSAGRPASPWDPEMVMRHYGETALLYASTAAALLVLFNVKLDNFYPPYSTLIYLNRVRSPQWDPSQVAALLLLLAGGAAGLTLDSLARWRWQASRQERRATALRNALRLVNAIILMWLGINVYVSLLAALHKIIGPLFFDLFGGSGNFVMALVTALLFFGLSLLIGAILRASTRRVQQFLAGPARAR